MKFAFTPCGTALGRSALLVFIAGTAGTALMLTASYLSQRFAPEIEKAPTAFMAVGFALGVGTYGWSIALAVRALYFRERARLPWIVLGLAFLPWCVALAYYLISLLKLTAPFIILAHLSWSAFGIAALALTFVFVKLISYRRVRRGTAPLISAQCLRVGFLSATLCVIFFGGTVAPVLYIILSVNLAPEFDVNARPFSNLPSIYSDVALVAMERIQIRSTPKYQIRGYCNLLSGGSPSESVLEARVRENYPITSHLALTGLFKRDPVRARALADELIFSNASKRSDLGYAFREQSIADRIWFINKTLDKRYLNEMWIASYLFTSPVSSLRDEKSRLFDRAIAQKLLSALRDPNPQMQRASVIIALSANLVREFMDRTDAAYPNRNDFASGYSKSPAKLSKKEQDAIASTIERLKELLKDPNLPE